MGVGLRPGAKAAGRATDPPTGHAPPLDSTRMVSVPCDQKWGFSPWPGMPGERTLRPSRTLNWRGNADRSVGEGFRCQTRSGATVPLNVVDQTMTNAAREVVLVLLALPIGDD